MSGIVAVLLQPGAGPAEEPVLDRMLAAMHARGSDRRATWSDGHTGLGVARGAWELGEDFGGGTLIARDRELALVADASIYYREELQRALRAAGVEARGETASDLILAAYRAWGEDCATHLDGDFAFALWDGHRQALLCARDYCGSRPLFYADLGGATLVASAISALLSHPLCPGDLNLAVIGEVAAGLLGATHETAYRAIRAVPAGATLRAGSARPLRLSRHWEAPRFPDAGEGPPFEEAARHLQETLCGAVAQRLSQTDTTSIWLSGGWDSTAVFGAGEALLRRRGGGEHLAAVSVSYPEGDPGREDELIEQVAAHWRAPVQWIDIGEIPLLPHAAERAAARDDPYAHPFETWNLSLARGSRRAGCRIAFTGKGGDELFAVSSVFMADLLRGGHWLTLWREWRARPRGGLRDFYWRVVEPALPHALRAARARLRGGAHRRFPGRDLPDWIEPGFAERHDLIERQRVELPHRHLSRAGTETLWLLAHPFFPRTLADVASFALAEGVEVRSPLFDKRVIALAAARPRWERATRGETKLLLRRAMRGLLPEAVLAPRSHRTGITTGYLYREIRERWSALFLRTFTNPVLATIGIVDPARLRSAWEAFQHRDRDQLAGDLLATLQTELWLRARVLAGDSPEQRRTSARVSGAGTGSKDDAAIPAVLLPGRRPGNP